jgi:hypothetical protein
MGKKRKLTYEAPLLQLNNSRHELTAFAIVWFTGLTALLAFFYLNYVADPAKQCELYGDFPFIGLRTVSAGRLNLLEGPYSRLSFSHPSPLLFYFYAVLESLLPTSGGFKAERLGQLIINGTCLTLGALLVVRSTAIHPVICFLIFGGTVAYFAPSASPFFAVDFWNPSTIVIPSITFALGLQSYLSGDRRSALPLGISAGILFSQHLSTAILVLLGFFAVVLLGVINPRRKPETGEETLALILPTSLGALPMLLDFITNQGKSNVAKIIEHVFERAPVHHTFARMFEYILVDLVNPTSAFVLSAILVVLALLTIKSKQALLTLAIFLVGSSCLVFGLRFSPGQLQPYQFFPMYGLLAFATIQCILLVVTSVLKNRPDPYLVLPFVVLGAGFIFLVPPPTLATAIAAPCAPPKWLPALRPHIKGRIVAIASHRMHGWDQAGALGYSLYQEGRPFCFFPKFKKYVTDDMICSPNQIAVSVQATFSRKNEEFYPTGDSLTIDHLDPTFEMHIKVNSSTF